MKKIMILLLTSALVIIHNSFGMDKNSSQNKTLSQENQSHKIENPQLQEMNRLLEENNKLLRTIIVQNHLIFEENRHWTYPANSDRARRYKKLDDIYDIVYDCYNNKFKYDNEFK